MVGDEAAEEANASAAKTVEREQADLKKQFYEALAQMNQNAYSSAKKLLEV